MNVLVLAPALYDTSPGQRFRIEQWARHLGRDGVRFTFAPFEDQALHDILYQRGRYGRKALLVLRAYARRLVQVLRVRDYDVVYLPREAAIVGPALVERLVARRGVPLVYDFDDPIWLPYRSPTHGLLSRLKCPGKTAAICRLADCVVAGNRLLAAWAGRHARAVHVVPSTVDLDRYPPQPERPPGRVVTLGWTGSHSTLPFLDLIRAALRRLAARYPLRLLLISHAGVNPWPDAPLPVVARRWAAATEATDLHDIDIGLGPFPDAGWTPWRCHGKVLQYMAAGIPTVASRLGVLPDYIRDGGTGFLAATDDEWVAKVSALIEAAALRRRIGLAGRQTIAEHYSARVWAPRVRSIIESVVRGRPTSAPSGPAAGPIALSQ